MGLRFTVGRASCQSYSAFQCLRPFGLCQAVQRARVAMSASRQTLAELVQEKEELTAQLRAGRQQRRAEQKRTRHETAAADAWSRLPQAVRSAAISMYVLADYSTEPAIKYLETCGSHAQADCSGKLGFGHKDKNPAVAIAASSPAQPSSCSL